MADMEIVPLFGSSFSVYAPIITAIVGFITFFNLYGRLLKFFGIQDEDSVTIGEFCTKPNATELEEIETGKKLVTGQIRRLNDILLAENRAAAMNKDTVALLPGSPNTSNTLGAADEDGDFELTRGGDDDEESLPKSGEEDMTSWGRATPATSSFYSSFKSEQKKETNDFISEKKSSKTKGKEENSLFGSWKSKELKSDSSSKVDHKKFDDSSSSSNSKDYKSLTSPRNSQETKGLSNGSNSSPASEPSQANDAWGATGGGWDVPAPARKGGRYG